MDLHEIFESFQKGELKPPKFQSKIIKSVTKNIFIFDIKKASKKDNTLKKIQKNKKTAAK